mmetsp:Transcript_15304/g.16545  ORF Transcript_15304/g.16545 Transcript_15304/m.16545 type:complete len:195 (+) Transcript_15304:142-726(+)
MKEKGRYRRENTTFLETHNCDSVGLPKPISTRVAKKEIYRSDYVLHHFVHYSLVTQGLLKTYDERQQWGEGITFREKEWNHYGNELKEAVMIHAKTVQRDIMYSYERVCQYYNESFSYPANDCNIGFAWPEFPNGLPSYKKNIPPTGKHSYGTFDGTKYKYNCFTNEHVEKYWVPKLNEAVAAHALQQTKIGGE